MDEQAVQQLRTELGQVIDQLGSLPGDAFAERVALHARREELSEQLAELADADSDEIKARWNERAGTKPDPQYHVEQVIHSPGGGEGGGWL